MTLEYIMDHWNFLVTPIFKKGPKKWSDPQKLGGKKLLSDYLPPWTFVVFEFCLSNSGKSKMKNRVFWTFFGANLAKMLIFNGLKDSNYHPLRKSMLLNFLFKIWPKKNKKSWFFMWGRSYSFEKKSQNGISAKIWEKIQKPRFLKGGVVTVLKKSVQN